MQPDDAFTVAAEDNIATVAGDRRTNPGVEQLLDLINDFLVGGVDASSSRSASSPSITGRPATKWSMMTPRTCGFSACQEISSFLVTVMKSPPRKTRATPGSANRCGGQRAARRR